MSAASAMHAVAGLGAAAEKIWESVSVALPDFTVEVLAEIDSTSTELMRRARAGRLEPGLLVAVRQNAGRGRLGREWHSQPGDSLTFSVGLPLAPADWSGMSLAVGSSVADSLDPGRQGLQLKWPNDLWFRERKLGGILVETASAGAGGENGAPARYAVIGIGLNIAARDASGTSVAPAWLREIDPDADAAQALLRVVPPLMQALKAFESLGFAPFQARFGARDLLRGRTVTVTEGGARVIEGTAQGVADNGALLVHTSAGMKQITSSEVSVRPVGATAG